MRSPETEDRRSTDPHGPSLRIIRKNLSVISLAYLVGAASGFAAQAFLARRLGGITFGVYVAALSLTTMISVLDELGGATYLVREGARDPGRLERLLGNVLLLKLAVNLVVVALALLGAWLLGFNRTGLALAGLLSIMLGANAMSRSLRAGLQAIERLEISASISIANSLVSAAGMIWLIAAGKGLVSAVAFSTGVSVVIVPISWLALRRHVRFRLRSTWRSARETARASFPFAAVGILTFATTYADALIVRRFLGDGATGLYGAAYRLMLVLQFIPSIYLDSVYRTLSYMSHNLRTQFGWFVDRSAAGLCLVALPFAAGGAVMGDRILTLVFGNSYAGAGEAFRILLWSLPFAFPGWILLAALVVDERPHTAGWLVTGAFCANLGINLLVIPPYGIVAAAWTTVGTEALLASAATVILIRRSLRIRWPLLAGPGLGAAGLMAVVVLPIRHLALPVPLAAGAVVYLGALFVTGTLSRLRWSFAPPPVGVTGDLPNGTGERTPGDLMPRLSVVMPVHNVAPFVEAAITSVLAQTFQDFEFIVVDDGSTDGTGEIAETIRDPRIRVVHIAHAGLVVAENLGLELARGEYVSRADGDDLFLARLFERQVAVLDAHPEVAAVGVWTRRFGWKQSSLRTPTDPVSIRRRLRRENALSNSVMFRASAARGVGGYRQVRWEDWDLWIRLAAHYDLRSIPECLVLLRYRPGSLFWSATRLQGRRAKLHMRWVAFRHLGSDVSSVLAIGKNLVAVAFFALFEGFLPPRKRPPEPDTRQPTLTVVIPTHGRAASLARCLAGVEDQHPPPDEVVVVHQRDDEPTVSFLQRWAATDPVRRRTAEVDRPGIVTALAAGTEVARSEVVAYLDDDAAPRPGWLGEILLGFSDTTVGAVGGRIVDHRDGHEITGRTDRVGRVTWYGRVIGRHHLGTDHYGDVEWLTGANMAFRRELVLHDSRLIHTSGGLALANDLDTCLTVRRAGYRVLFTPWAVVDHHTTSFRDPDLSSRVVAGGDVFASAANHTYALLKYMPRGGRMALRGYGYLVGSSSLPGPWRALIELPRSPRRAMAMVSRIRAVWRGRAEGARRWHAWRSESPDGSREISPIPPESELEEDRLGGAPSGR